MKSFEIFQSTKGQNGRRKFKIVLHQIYPDSCIDELNEAGTEYNLNGITWIREYCERALSSIKGMSLRAEFLDEDRTELCGHGQTDVIDGVPIFENATVIGTFNNGYIEEIEDSDGNTILACIGEGEIDYSCYPKLCDKLDDEIADGNYPQGSVEIMRCAENNGIVYKYGYKEYGRIPTEFIYSGYALLGVTPSDKTAKLVELNNKNKEDIQEMTDVEIKKVVELTVAALNNHTAELNQVREDCEAKVNEANEKAETVANEKNELTATVEQLKAALEKVQKDYEELNRKWDELWQEKVTLEKALGEAQAKERIGELNAALAEYSDEEKAFAQAEIDAFMAAPVESEINSVTNKILIGIGKKAREEAAANVVAEQNSAKNIAIEDIFSGVDTPSTNAEDTNIF